MTLEARSVFIPLVVLMTLLLGLFIFFEQSYAHLNDIGLHISYIQDRQRLLAQLARTINEAEAAQRGYLLSQDSYYLSRYEDVKGRVNIYVGGLRESYRENGVPVNGRIDAIGGLARERLSQIDRSLQLHAESGGEAAVSSVLLGSGKETMQRYQSMISEQEAQEANALVDAWARYLVDLRRTRLAMTGATVLNVILMLLVGVLLWRTLQLRTREAKNLQQEVHEHAAELASLSSYLQHVSEREKQQLARELHDSLGGLLVATKMDLAWLRARVPTDDPELLLRWRRIQSSLDQGVDLKRRVVEQLRPTLLDNMGLYAALRWQLQETCGRAGLQCIERLPDIEARLTSEASIALFRVAQESITNILKHSGATRVELSISLDADYLTMIIGDNGRGFDPKAASGQGIAGMRHRVRALGGTIHIAAREEGGTEIRVRIPLIDILQREGEPRE